MPQKQQPNTPIPTKKFKTARLKPAKTHEIPEVAWGFFISLEQRLERLLFGWQ
jgi:hypothetical protein